MNYEGSKDNRIVVLRSIFKDSQVSLNGSEMVDIGQCQEWRRALVDKAGKGMRPIVGKRTACSFNSVLGELRSLIGYQKVG